MVELTRVESVEVLEPRSEEFARLSGGEDYVKCYDLKVSGHPSYCLGRSGFVSHNCTDTDEFSKYNEEEYFYKAIDDALLNESMGIESLLDFPHNHRDYIELGARFWIGADLGWCVDTETEILTQRGWLRYNELLIGDTSLSLNPDTGMAEWQPITDLYINTGHYEMVSMQGQTFDSVTTPHHRWLCKVREREEETFHWKTTETLNTEDSIPMSATVSNLPTTKKYSDATVELAAWIFCEGTIRGNSVELSQSHIKNSIYTLEIENLLTHALGDPGYVRDGFLWRSELRFTPEDGLTHHGDEMTYFYINKEAVDRLRLKEVFLGQEKELDPKFITSLTQEQLLLFQRTCIKGDGSVDKHDGQAIEQHSLARIKSYEMVCAIAGLTVATGHSNTRDSDRWNTRVLQCNTVAPVAAAANGRTCTDMGMSITSDKKIRTIWCPTIKYGNFLARRNGSIYYTGNTVSPTAIVVFAEYKEKGKDSTTLRLLTRILLRRISAKEQVDAVMHFMDFYRPKAFALDYTGAGQPMYAWLQEKTKEGPNAYMLDRLKSFGFAEKVIVGFDDAVEIPDTEDGWKEAAIKRGVIEASTDAIRTLVDNKRLALPMDQPLLSEFQSVPRSLGMTIDQYGRSTRKVGMHSLDAVRMACLAHSQEPIQMFIDNQKKNRWEAPAMVLV